MSQILVKCIRGPADVEAQGITNNLIVSNSMAIARGKRFLDDPSQGAYYLTWKRTLKVLHKGGHVLPGTWITVTAPQLGLYNQKLKVVNVETSISPKEIYDVIETHQYMEFNPS